MEITIFSIFPEMFAPLNASLLGKAQEKGVISLEIVDFRHYSLDKHRAVDDYPFGGGAGMVLTPQPIVDALRDKLNTTADDDLEIIMLSPQGQVFDQQAARRLAQKKKLAFVCGHYEGFDERIRSFVDSEYTIGDYVLTGGELPAMVMIDAICRLIPGVIKEQASFEEDSFYQGLLEYPQYTRPRIFEGMEVPEILIGGHHEKIRLWRKKQSLLRTLLRRPDLLHQYPLNQEEEKLLAEIKMDLAVGENHE